CGSTVQAAGQQSMSSVSGSAAATDERPSGPGSAAAVGSAQANTGGAPAQDTGSSSLGSSTTAGSGRGLGGGAGAAPHAPVELGVYALKNIAAAGNAMGIGQYYSNFDQQAQAQALAANVNRQGGLVGHVIRL